MAVSSDISVTYAIYLDVVQATTDERIERVRRGLLPTLIMQLAHDLRIPDRNLAHYLGLNRATLRRKIADDERLGAQESEGLLATAELMRRPQDAARTLLAEMERADVVSDGVMPADVIRMNSRVEFEIDGGKPQQAELVFPRDANIDEKRISVLTPIGAALIGLSTGQMMMWRGRDGRPHKLRVVSVAEPVVRNHDETLS